MVLAAGHGTFNWRKDAAQPVCPGAVLEEICRMARLAVTLDPNAESLPEHIIRKHREREARKRRVLRAEKIDS